MSDKFRRHEFKVSEMSWKVMSISVSVRIPHIRHEFSRSIAQIESAEDIIAIGFLFENTTEGNVEPAVAVASIAEIEARSGIKFFPTLNPSIEKAVKEQKNIADWKAFK